MLKEFKIYYEGEFIATCDGLDEVDVLSRFMRKGGAGYAYGRLHAVKAD